MDIEIPTVAAGLRSWPARRWFVAAGASIVLAVGAGAVTDVIPNPLASREMPVTWWSYPTLAIAALLSGLVMATYVRSPAEPVATGKATSGGLLSAFAISCPVCNKLVVLALGTSGAVSVWAPLQPILAVASIVLLGWALRTRLAAERSCPTPVRPAAAPPAGSDGN